MNITSILQAPFLKRLVVFVSMTLVLTLALGSLAASASPQVAKMKPLGPCCEIVKINSQTRVVTASVKSSGRRFLFVVKDAALLRSLQVGQNVYANLQTKQVSLDGRNACCGIGGYGTWMRYGTVVSVSGNQVTAAPPPTRAEEAARAAARAGHIVSGVVPEVQRGNASPHATYVLTLPALTASSTRGSQQIAKEAVRLAQWYGFRLALTAPPPQPGQTIWINPQMRMAQYVSFPIHSRLWNEPSNGDHMDTSITISYGATGQVHGTTHLYTGRAAYGFNGTVRVVFLDDSGNPLFTTDPIGWEVHGTIERDKCAVTGGNCPNDWTEGWTKQVPKQVLDQVRAVSIVHTAQDLPWKDLLDLAKTIFDCASAIYTDATQSSSTSDGSGTSGGSGSSDGTVYALPPPTPQGGTQDGQQGGDILKACFGIDSGGGGSSGGSSGTVIVHNWGAGEDNTYVVGPAVSPTANVTVNAPAASEGLPLQLSTDYPKVGTAPSTVTAQGGVRTASFRVKTKTTAATTPGLVSLTYQSPSPDKRAVQRIEPR